MESKISPKPSAPPMSPKSNGVPPLPELPGRLLLLPSCLSELVGVLPVLAELVVFLAFLRVGEHLVGLVYFLELSLGRLVAGVNVRVILAGQLPIRLLDILFSGVSSGTPSI